MILLEAPTSKDISLPPNPSLPRHLILPINETDPATLFTGSVDSTALSISTMGCHIDSSGVCGGTWMIKLAPLLDSSPYLILSRSSNTGYAQRSSGGQISSERQWLFESLEPLISEII